MARRLEALPALRQSIATGNLSWSMGELLARVAQAGDEQRWVEMAKSHTVRQMRAHVSEALADPREPAAARLQAHPDLPGTTVPAGAREPTSAVGSEATSSMSERISSATGPDTPPTSEGLASDESHCVGDEACTLTCTVDREEAWLFEATRSLLEQLGVHGTEAQSEALLAEAQSTLLALVPGAPFTLDRARASGLAQQHWLEELARWRAESEALCEKANAGWHRIARAENSVEAIGGVESKDGVESKGGVESKDGVESKGGATTPARGVDVSHGAAADAAALGMASLEGMQAEALDAYVRSLAEALARHELEFSRLVLCFHHADGWRQLGYATETQYARERLGASRSSLLARRSLALRLEKLPVVARALGAGQLGVEAALQVVRVATAATQAAWVERAGKRTIKHLREEVSAALVAIRSSGEADCLPPTDAEMSAFQTLEQAVVSGPRGVQPSASPVRSEGAADTPAAWSGPTQTAGDGGLGAPASKQRRAWRVMLGSLAAWLQAGLGQALQMSASPSESRAGDGVSIGRGVGQSAGRVTLRLRMSRETACWWRSLEAQARISLPRGMSWLRFLCLSVWDAWQHLLGAEVAYGHIYIRDRYRCMSPVCNRRDVTPHHLQFRSAGGSDEAHNVGSFCTWCHLHGVHGGRIRARGMAHLIHWEFGAPDAPCLIVHGRERMAA
jgi:hypothetical protein